MKTPAQILEAIDQRAQILFDNSSMNANPRDIYPFKLGSVEFALKQILESMKPSELDKVVKLLHLKP